jgi:hypothetical protein
MLGDNEKLIMSKRLREKEMDGIDKVWAEKILSDPQLFCKKTGRSFFYLYFNKDRNIEGFVCELCNYHHIPSRNLKRKNNECTGYYVSSNPSITHEKRHLVEHLFTQQHISCEKKAEISLNSPFNKFNKINLMLNQTDETISFATKRIHQIYFIIKNNLPNSILPDLQNLFELIYEKDKLKDFGYFSNTSVSEFIQIISSQYFLK